MVIAVLVIGYRRADVVERRLSRRPAGGRAALGLIGVGVDTLHRFGAGAEWSNVLFTLGEDGGERVVMSVLRVWVFRATRPTKTC